MAIQADKAGITPRMLNNPPESAIDIETVSTIMKDLNPDRYIELLNKSTKEEERMEEKEAADEAPKTFMEMEATK